MHIPFRIRKGSAPGIPWGVWALRIDKGVRRTPVPGQSIIKCLVHPSWRSMTELEGEDSVQISAPAPVCRPIGSLPTTSFFASVRLVVCVSVLCLLLILGQSALTPCLFLTALTIPPRGVLSSRLGGTALWRDCALHCAKSTRARRVR